MAKISRFTLNNDGEILFRGLATASKKNTSATVRFNPSHISARKKRANRKNSVGNYTAEILKKMKIENLADWKLWAQARGFQWRTAAAFLAKNLRDSGLGEIGKFNLSSTHLGGVPILQKTILPARMFNRILACRNDDTGGVYLFHKQPKNFIIREKIPELKNVYENKNFSMNSFEKLTFSFDFEVLAGAPEIDAVIRLYEDENAAGVFDSFSLKIRQSGHYEILAEKPSKNYNSFVVFFAGFSGTYAFAIDNVSVKDKGIELFAGGDFEDWERRALPYFSDSLPVFEWDGLLSGVEYLLDYYETF